MTILLREQISLTLRWKRRALLRPITRVDFPKLIFSTVIAAAVLICWFFDFFSAIATICFVVLFPLSKNFLEKGHLRTYLKNALNRTNFLINLVKWALEHFIHHIACSWLWLSVSFYAFNFIVMFIFLLIVIPRLDIPSYHLQAIFL